MHSTVTALPEFCTLPELLELGWPTREAQALQRSGALVRVRHGHYARADARPQLVRAVRLGGQLTSYSALAEWGAWIPPGDTRLHVAVDSHARMIRDPDSGCRFAPRADVVVHWKNGIHRLNRRAGIVPLPRAVRHLPTRLDPAWVVAVLDSALRNGITTTAQLCTEFGSVPRLARALRHVDPRAESGTESVARVRLREAGIEADLQVQIGPHRVDLLIAGRLVVEIDGREFHDTESTFERDRRRDADLTRRGFRVLRFTYAQVLTSWASCLAAIRTALALP